jgi:hypothetical protein
MARLEKGDVSLIASFVTPAVATYAAVISTLSFVLAVKVYKAGDPEVELGWKYNELIRNLSLIVSNTGRGNVTISTIDLYIVRHEITRRSPISDAVAIHRETISHVSSELWRGRDLDIPVRLESHAEVSISVKGEAVKLPSLFPFDDLLLKFVARYPGGKQIAYVRGEILRHFLGIDLDRPITLPSPGAVPTED